MLTRTQSRVPHPNLYLLLRILGGAFVIIVALVILSAFLDALAAGWGHVVDGIEVVG